MRYRFEVNSPLGPLRLFAVNDALSGLYFENHVPAPKETTGTWDAKPFRSVSEQLEKYFAEELDEFDVPISFSGTDFQEQVWQALRTIPIGETKSYLEIANACGRSKAVRAVGGAVGRNPVSIIVPCHRVIGSNGKLTGFAGGTKRKRWLLQRESAALPIQ